MAGNILYYGDNLDVLRRYIKDETIDLIYLDPPFKSEQDYNVLFAEQNGSRAAAQIKAFEDTWRWDQATAKSYQETVETGPQSVSQVMQAFYTFLGGSDMMAYLAMMAPRLVELRRRLKPTGSIYLHCDPTASHYLKLLMDAVFGPNRFGNEIVWSYRTGGVSKRTFARKHDTILFYTKSDPYLFNTQYYKSWQLKQYKYTEKYPEYYDEQKKMWYHLAVCRDVWEDINPIGTSAKERLGYPTQKPEALLERIIMTSSNEGDVILDPFCGCGTAIVVAEQLKRRWIGIDITHLAVALMKHRLRDAFGNKVKYRVIGEPVSLPDAKTLAEENRYQFQWWALGLVGARPVEQKKGADKGIDGRLYFHDEADTAKTKTKQIIISVKSGKVGVRDVRDLRGVVEREKAQIGALISVEKPTKAMRTEAASAGFYKSPWGEHAILQILTVEQLLQGKNMDYPDVPGVNVTFRKAPKARNRRIEDPEFDYPRE
jgi:site-specific DNA-methyltransferase (adenine-specific)